MRAAADEEQAMRRSIRISRVKQQRRFSLAFEFTILRQMTDEVSHLAARHARFIREDADGCRLVRAL